MYKLYFKIFVYDKQDVVELINMNFDGLQVLRSVDLLIYTIHLCKATPNETLVSHPPYTAHYMQVGSISFMYQV